MKNSINCMYLFFCQQSQSAQFWSHWNLEPPCLQITILHDVTRRVFQFLNACLIRFVSYQVRAWEIVEIDVISTRQYSQMVTRRLKAMVHNSVAYIIWWPIEINRESRKKCVIRVQCRPGTSYWNRKWHDPFVIVQSFKSFELFALMRYRYQHDQHYWLQTFIIRDLLTNNDRRN